MSVLLAERSVVVVTMAGAAAVETAVVAAKGMAILEVEVALVATDALELDSVAETCAMEAPMVL